MDLFREEQPLNPLAGEGSHTPGRGRGVKSTADPVTQRRIDEALKRLEQRKTITQAQEVDFVQATPAKNLPLTNQLVLLDAVPAWDDSNRGAPNALIRSGLFTVSTSKTREFVDKQKVASLGNYDIRYSGQTLGQDDLSVFMSIVNMAKSKPLTEPVAFTGYHLVNDLAWRMHSESYERARDCISRLKVTAVEVVTKGERSGYSGSLIRDYAWNHMGEDGTQRWMVNFEPRICQIFMPDSTTLIEWEMRKRIGSKATVALWLHAYYSSHRDPYPVTVVKLHEMCRSASPVSTFRRTLQLSLQKLLDLRFLLSFEIEKDLVRVVRSGGRVALPG